MSYLTFQDNSTNLTASETVTNLNFNPVVLRSILDLTDVTSTFSGAAYKLLRVNSGASAVEFTSAPSNISYVDFDTADASASAEGRLKWNSDDGTLEVGMPGGNVNIQLGQEHTIRATNKTGGNLTNGQVVYVSGAQGQRPTIALALADAEATSHGTIALLTENIDDNNSGFITTAGLVRDVDTSSFTAGDILYLSAVTPGAFTNVAPSAPNHAVIVGYCVYSHATEGKVLVNVQVGGDLDSLHDVNIGTPNNGDALIYNSGAGYWEPGSAGVSDHGALSGLTDDDHTQYLVTANATASRNTVAPSADVVPLTLKGHSGATANLLEVQNNAGTVLSSFDNTGQLTIAANAGYTIPAIEVNVPAGGQYGVSGGAISVKNSAGLETFSVGGWTGYYDGLVTLSAPTGQGGGCGIYFRSDIGGGNRTGQFQLDGSGNMVFSNYNAAAGTYFDYQNGLNFRDGSGNTVFFASSNRRIGINEGTPAAQLEVQSTAAANIVGIFQGYAAQSANLLEFQNSSATKLSEINKDGRFLAPGGSNSAPGLSFTNDSDSGFFNTNAGWIGLAINGTTQWYIGQTPARMESSVSNGPSIPIAGGTATTPSYTFSNDLNTGIAYGGADQLNLVAGGVAVMTLSDDVGAETVLVTNADAANIGLTVKGAASQSANLTEWQNSSATVLAKVDSAGAMYASSFTLSALNTAPSSASDTGTTGEIRWDASSMYVCVGTNTWKKVDIATW